MTGLGLALVATVVEWADIGRTVVASVVAGVGVTAAFAVAILGSAQFVERRRGGETARAAAAGLLGVIGLAVCVAAITLGLIVMLGD